MPNDCPRCKELGEFAERARDLHCHTPFDFLQILGALRIFLDQMIRDHLASHERDPGAMAKRQALQEKEIKVVGRHLGGFRRYCDHHPGQDGVVSVRALYGAEHDQCQECLEALVKKARETPVFSSEDAAAVDESVKGIS